jgi:hypothetical protein
MVPNVLRVPTTCHHRAFIIAVASITVLAMRLRVSKKSADSAVRPPKTIDKMDLAFGVFGKK